MIDVEDRAFESVGEEVVGTRKLGGVEFQDACKVGEGEVGVSEFRPCEVCFPDIRALQPRLDERGRAASPRSS